MIRPRPIQCWHFYAIDTVLVASVRIIKQKTENKKIFNQQKLIYRVFLKL